MLASDKYTQNNPGTNGYEKALFGKTLCRYLARKRAHGPVLLLESQMNAKAGFAKNFIAADPLVSLEVRKDDIRVFLSDRYQEKVSANKLLESFKKKVSSKGRTKAAEKGSYVYCNREDAHAWDALEWFRSACGGWAFGWLSYDLKNDLENLDSQHPDPVSLPDLYFFQPGTLLEFDRETGSVRFQKGDAGEWERISEYVEEYRPEFTMTRELVSAEGWDSYRAKVNQIKRHIAEGDTYEVNYTHQLSAAFEGDSLNLFERMRRSNPAPYASWIHFNGIEVCCSSPERFLKKNGSMVCSHPIKGTAPRGKDPEDDRLIIENILNQDKNVAENVMIVDLVRNDLSVVAETGSVRVENLLDVQSFATVHQLVSEITARAKSDTSAVDIIKSCFPMGSMTGAPKIRTMELIETYESYRRGLYSGAIGFFTPMDDFDFNVVIRTAILKEGSMYYSVGGAITSGSDPRDEWKESWLKAKAVEVITESPGANPCPADKKNLSCFES